MRSRMVLAWAGLLVMFFGGRLMTTDIAAQYQVAQSIIGPGELFTAQDGWLVSGIRSDSYVPTPRAIHSSFFPPPGPVLSWAFPRVRYSQP